MQTFDLEVASLRGSWVIKLDGRVVSGSATLAGADRVARHAADSLLRSGYGVRLSTPAHDEHEPDPVTQAAA
jgi:hypothetical protein